MGRGRQMIRPIRLQPLLPFMLGVHVDIVGILAPRQSQLILKGQAFSRLFTQRRGPIHEAQPWSADSRVCEFAPRLAASGNEISERNLRNVLSHQVRQA
jgi:hypothetical protein